MRLIYEDVEFSTACSYFSRMVLFRLINPTIEIEILNTKCKRNLATALGGSSKNNFFAKLAHV